jgi:hypothetical protein
MGWILLIKSLKNLETTRWESGKTNRVFTNVWWWSLNIDEIDLLNKYGCRPFPRPDALPCPHQLGQVFLTLYDKTDKVRSILIRNSLKMVSKCDYWVFWITKR